MVPTYLGRSPGSSASTATAASHFLFSVIFISFAMPGLVPGIRVLFSPLCKNVDGRDEAGHNRDGMTEMP